jgi:cytochrome c oxidase subunit 3
MKEDFSSDGNKEQMDKAKKNLVYFGIMSVVMLFAGFSSAYIVSMGDSFWLKFPLPTAFWISTVIIVISSVAIQAAVYFSKKGNANALKMAVSITFILGLGFVYFQFKGYGQLIDNGIHAVNNHIIVTDGKYGDYYEVKYKGDFVEINGNDYLLKGKKMTDTQVGEYQKFMAQFLEMKDSTAFEVDQYGKDFVLYLEDAPLEIEGKTLKKADGEELQFLDRMRLRDLAINVRDLRGDFFVKGEIGKDFHIYYKGEELEYKDRQLHKDGKILKNYLQIKSMESPDTASSYLYIITFLHLLHILVTLLYVMRLVIHSFSGRINAENNISIQTGAIFWHFLGLLWLYLLLFLLFIH